MAQTLEGKLTAEGLRFGIVVSRFNALITEPLLEGALETLTEHGARDEDIVVVRVPGAFEIPVAVARLAESQHFDALICLGAVIRGDTPHFDYISAEVTNGISSVALALGVPITNGVLTCDTLEQAIVRADREAREVPTHDAEKDAILAEGAEMSNKGAEAASCAVEMANLFAELPPLSGDGRFGDGHQILSEV